MTENWFEAKLYVDHSMPTQEYNKARVITNLC